MHFLYFNRFINLKLDLFCNVQSESFKQCDVSRDWSVVGTRPSPTMSVTKVHLTIINILNHFSNVFYTWNFLIICLDFSSHYIFNKLLVIRSDIKVLLAF